MYRDDGVFISEETSDKVECPLTHTCSTACEVFEVQKIYSHNSLTKDMGHWDVHGQKHFHLEHCSLNAELALLPFLPR